MAAVAGAPWQTPPRAKPSPPNTASVRPHSWRSSKPESGRPAVPSYDTPEQCREESRPGRSPAERVLRLRLRRTSNESPAAAGIAGTRHRF